MCARHMYIRAILSFSLCAQNLIYIKNLAFFRIQGDHLFLGLKLKKTSNNSRHKLLFIKLGQKSYTALNRVPNYLFWDSMWHSKFAIKNIVYLDFFLKSLINLCLVGRLSATFTAQLFKNSNLKYNQLDNTDFKISSLKDKEQKLYISKFWFLKFKNWLIVSLFIFYPSGTTTRVENSSDDENAGSLNLWNESICIKTNKCNNKKKKFYF